MSRTAAGIVLFNPDIERLKENIDSVIVQCERLYIIDNASGNIDAIRSMVREYGSQKILLVENKSNLGIARAFNQICRNADIAGYEWVLTLDQDSVCPPDLIRAYEKYTESGNIAMLCPVISDRNAGVITHTADGKTEVVTECISSGSMLRLSVWKQLDGFDEYLFIDGVDFDLCHRINAAGFRIVRINSIILSHELGCIKVRTFLFRKVRVRNHSAFRKYYISRNTIYLARKEKHPMRVVRAVLQNIKLLLVNLLYEEDKLNKAKMILIGTRDGLRPKKE